MRLLLEDGALSMFILFLKQNNQQTLSLAHHTKLLALQIFCCGFQIYLDLECEGAVLQFSIITNESYYLITQMTSIRDFTPICKLGEGSYSTVYKVQRINDQQFYALKKVKMNQLSTKEKENALNEVRILASIQSPAIIAYKQAFFDTNINVLCVVMEFADGGDLHHYIGEVKRKKMIIPQTQIWAVVKNMLLALQTLHKRGIMHRDLKSANIFKTTCGYKLGDLNVSKVVTGNLAYTQTGTPYYASPEVWRDEPYDSKSDVWSLGCIIFEMAMLRPPFEGKDMQQLFKNVQSKAVPHVSNYYSPQLAEFIYLCLRKKPSTRPTACDLLNISGFQKYLQSYRAVISEQKLQKKLSEKQNLLQTIKLPSDLTKLKDKLPNSKYESENKNKSMLVQSRGISSQKELHRMQDKKVNINKSEIFRSPPSKANLQENIKVVRSPVTDIKLNPKLSQVIAKYSDRIYLSDKKTNKVERGSTKNYEQGYLNIEKYIKQEIIRRPTPQLSMPRTEKVVLKDRVPVLGPSLKSESLIPADIEQLRRKLVKKCRVLSNNKPSWWG